MEQELLLNIENCYLRAKHIVLSSVLDLVDILEQSSRTDGFTLDMAMICESYKDESQEIFGTTFCGDYVVLSTFTILKLAEIAPTTGTINMALRKSVQCTEVEESSYEDIERAIVSSESLVKMGLENLFAILGSENRERRMAILQILMSVRKILEGAHPKNSASCRVEIGYLHSKVVQESLILSNGTIWSKDSDDMMGKKVYKRLRRSFVSSKMLMHHEKISTGFSVARASANPLNDRNPVIAELLRCNEDECKIDIFARSQVPRSLWNIIYGDGRPNDISGRSYGCVVKLPRWRKAFTWVYVIIALLFSVSVAVGNWARRDNLYERIVDAIEACVTLLVSAFGLVKLTSEDQNAIRNALLGKKVLQKTSEVQRYLRQKSKGRIKVFAGCVKPGTRWLSDTNASILRNVHGYSGIEVIEMPSFEEMVELGSYILGDLIVGVDGQVHKLGGDGSIYYARDDTPESMELIEIEPRGLIG